MTKMSAKCSNWSDPGSNVRLVSETRFLQILDPYFWLMRQTQMIFLLHNWINETEDEIFTNLSELSEYCRKQNRVIWAAEVSKVKGHSTISRFSFEKLDKWSFPKGFFYWHRLKGR